MKKISYSLLFIFIISSCAIETMPVGGDKDITPPEVISSNPENLSILFDATEIVLDFNEYIVLKNFSAQFSVSPPLDEKVEYDLKGKTLTLKSPGGYKANTTYTFSFGNAIQDITEGNAQTDFKYIFSTGDFIDSSFVAGLAYNAFTGRPEENLLAALYAVSEDDSLPYKEKPLYYGLTDSRGRFVINHIKDQDYKLIIFEDQNFDFTLTSRSEKKGFLDKPIDARIDSTYDVPVFKETRFFKVYGAEYNDYGKAEVYLSSPLNNFDQIKLQNYSGDHFIIPDANKDTLNLWFDPVGLDTLELHIYHPESQSIDTFLLNLTEIEAAQLRVNGKMNILTPSNYPTFTSNYPIKDINKDSILFTLNADTLKTPAFVIDSETYEITAKHVVKFGDKMNFYFYPGALTDKFNHTNDSTAFVFKTKKDADYAFLILQVNYQSETSGIIELLNQKNKVVISEIIRKNNSFEIPYLEPGKYSLRLIIDKNENAKWDSGDFYEKRQPEKVIYYNEAIDLRANWEIEVDFNINPDQW